MRRILLSVILVIGFSVIIGFGQVLKSGNQKNFRLVGKISTIELEESKTNIYLKLKLQFTLTNIGDKTLLFWKREIPTRKGKTLSKAFDFNSEDILSKVYGGPSYDISDEWNALQIALDTEVPSDEFIRSLPPNESWSFVDDDVYIITEKGDIKRKDKITYNELKENSAVWIKIFYETWSPNLEPDVYKNHYYKPFGKKLQKRWEKRGILWLDDISSEPIILDLSCITVKTTS